MSLSNEEIQKILDALEEAFEAHGRKLQTAVLVNDIVDGEVVGETLIDNREENDKH